MPITDEQYKRLLFRAAGSRGEEITDDIDIAWDRHDNKGDKEMQYSYALLDVFGVLMGMTWEDYRLRTAAGEEIGGDQPFTHLIAMAQRAEAFIAKANVAALSGDGTGEPLVTDMAGTAPLQTPDFVYPDPNDTLYQGDPYAIQRRVWRTLP